MMKDDFRDESRSMLLSLSVTSTGHSKKDESTFLESNDITSFSLERHYWLNSNKALSVVAINFHLFTLFQN